MSRSVTAALGVLLALFGALATVTGTAAQAIAGVGGPPGADVRQVVSAASISGGRAAEAPDQRVLCQRDRLEEDSAEYRDRQDFRAPEKRDHATVRKAAVDQTEWIQPGGGVVAVPHGPSADVSTQTERPVPHLPYRTFDGRAPPES